MIKITTLVNKSRLSIELFLEILSYLKYTEYKGMFIMAKADYIYWASLQTKRNLGSLFINGVRHSIYGNPSVQVNDDKMWHKFVLMHRLRGPAVISQTHTTYVEYGIRLRQEIFENKSQHIFKHGLYHGNGYVYGVDVENHGKMFKELIDQWWGSPQINLDGMFRKTVAMAFNKLGYCDLSRNIILARLVRVVEIVEEILDKIQRFDFDDVRRNKTGSIGSKEEVTYRTQQGDVIYMNHGVVDRSDGPAVILADRTKLFYRNGKLKRITARRGRCTCVGWCNCIVV